MSCDRTENRIEKKHLRRRRRINKEVRSNQPITIRFVNNVMLLHLRRRRQAMPIEKTGHSKQVRMKIMINDNRNKLNIKLYKISWSSSCCAILRLVWAARVGKGTGMRP